MAGPAGLRQLLTFVRFIYVGVDRQANRRNAVPSTYSAEVMGR
jgi:hypothetical protein